MPSQYPIGSGMYVEEVAFALGVGTPAHAASSCTRLRLNALPLSADDLHLIAVRAQVPEERIASEIVSGIMGSTVDGDPIFCPLLDATISGTGGEFISPISTYSVQRALLAQTGMFPRPRRGTIGRQAVVDNYRHGQVRIVRRVRTRAEWVVRPYKKLHVRVRYERRSPQSAYQVRAGCAVFATQHEAASYARQSTAWIKGAQVIMGPAPTEEEVNT